MKARSIKSFMNKAYEEFDAQKFLAEDQIQIVHKMASMSNATTADIEICAIWTAMLSFGPREYTIKNTNILMDLCNWQPAEFVKTGDFYDIPDDKGIHQTIQGKQFKAVNHNLRATYNKVSSVASYIADQKQTVSDLIEDLSESLAPARLGSPTRNSACKRINLILRWMVRKDDVDLGLWNFSHTRPEDLYAIMDRQVAQQASKMGLISYPKDSWKAVLELTNAYRKWDPTDPLKYDFVLSTKNVVR